MMCLTLAIDQEKEVCDAREGILRQAHCKGLGQIEQALPSLQSKSVPQERAIKQLRITSDEERKRICRDPKYWKSQLCKRFFLATDLSLSFLSLSDIPDRSACRCRELLTTSQSDCTRAGKHVAANILHNTTTQLANFSSSLTNSSMLSPSSPSCCNGVNASVSSLAHRTENVKFTKTSAVTARRAGNAGKGFGGAGVGIGKSGAGAGAGAGAGGNEVFVSMIGAAMLVALSIAMTLLWKRFSSFLPSTSCSLARSLAPSHVLLSCLFLSLTPRRYKSGQRGRQGEMSYPLRCLADPLLLRQLKAASTADASPAA
eukprot:766854-Hanusia_phi.AAC.1